MFKVKSTGDNTESTHKVLLYAHHGFGKTYQCRFFEKRYGKGLILSGESGLKSIEDVSIDFVPFQSWDGAHDPDAGIYSFRQVLSQMKGMIDKGGFPYSWIALDSLTELGDLVHKHCEKENEGNGNNFQVWADYKKIMIGTLKIVRDLPIHVYVTCLAKEEPDANGVNQFWPHVEGKAVGKQIPAIFDHVFCGVRSTDKSDNTVKVTRHIITEEMDGWHGKARDPLNTLSPRERVADVTELLERMKGE